MTHIRKGAELNLLDVDIIHNPNDKSYQGIFEQESTYSIDNFLSINEVETVRKVFYDNSHEHINIFDVIKILQRPFRFKQFRDVISNKIKTMFPDTYLLTEFLPNSTQSSDFIMLQREIFFPHTDSIIHIPEYVPYKDLLIPLDVDDDVDCPFYTCNQRYYGRATSFRYGKYDKVVAQYSNSVRYQSYHDYGVTNIDPTNPMIEDFYLKYLDDSENTLSICPASVWTGLSVEKLFPWKIGSLIVMDPSVIHGPTNYKLSGGNFKMGLTVRLFKHVPEYSPDTTFSVLH